MQYMVCVCVYVCRMRDVDGRSRQRSRGAAEQHRTQQRDTRRPELRELSQRSVQRKKLAETEIWSLRPRRARQFCAGEEVVGGRATGMPEWWMATSTFTVPPSMETPAP